MFDTSLVKSRASSARYRLLTASIAVHTAVIVGAIGLSVASVELPEEAPDQIEMFRAVNPPPPLGPGGPPPKPDRPQKIEPSTTPLVPKVENVAPDPNAALPDPQPATDAATTPDSGGGEPGDGGSEGGGGDPNGVIGGTGTEPGGTDLLAGPSTDIVHRPGGEVRPARVLTRVEPRYPSAFARIRMSAVVKIRCIIDRNGNVRDAEIVTSSFPPFNESVIEALHRWTFAPGTMRGQPVDTYFELTVKFQTKG